MALSLTEVALLFTGCIALSCPDFPPCLHRAMTGLQLIQRYLVRTSSYNLQLWVVKRWAPALGIYFAANGANMARVQIFDDDQDILELCGVILRAKGHVTEGNTTCVNVLEKAMAFQPDVILMDNWIPETGGVEATLALKKHNNTKGIPVIFFSASNDVQEYAEKATADYFLKKPFNITELQNLIVSASTQLKSAEAK